MTRISSPPLSLLQPGRNCWRVETAQRVAFVVDADAYFRVARATLLRARHSILVLGWDYHPRVRLEPGEAAAAGAPDVMRDLLEELVRTRPDLQVRVLKWNLALLFSAARKMVPIFLRNWRTGPRLRLRLDAEHPSGACHHQKVLVIDDAIAFCGGIDFAGNRWDTRAHPDHDPRRRRPDGSPYEPHHDMMMAVDGDAAAALGELARERWWRATGERLAPPPRTNDPWPDELNPDLRRVTVGIARTAPAYDGRPEIREVEALYLDAIAAAREALYFESQYLASGRIVDALAARLGEPDGPEVVVINPKNSPSWLEQETMDAARDLAVRHLRAADRRDRFRIYAAVTEGGRDIVVHAKAMVADDRLVRIGSANLNNRSMGFDTECDLATEASPGAPQAGEVRRAIRDFRDGLVAEHLRLPLDRVREAITNAGSLVRAIEALREGPGRGLEELPPARISGLDGLANSRPIDPEQPEPREGLGKLIGRWVLGSKPPPF